jgi:4a-hydroxytetrahydrobiopterin dehydratase
MTLSRDKLSPETVAARLVELEGWAVQNGRLHKRFAFADFVQAFGFMTKVAIEAEKLDHHPNWSNVYAKVEIELWTHDVGGITEYDLQLAQRMNRHAA